MSRSRPAFTSAVYCTSPLYIPTDRSGGLPPLHSILISLRYKFAMQPNFACWRAFNRVMNARTPFDNLTDEQLMQRMAVDDCRAFDALLLRHQTPVYHFIRHMVPDPEQAEDLTQECLLRVWQARRSYLPTAAFRTWLFTIARRLALDAARRALSRPETPGAPTRHPRPPAGTGGGRDHLRAYRDRLDTVWRIDEPAAYANAFPSGNEYIRRRRHAVPDSRRGAYGAAHLFERDDLLCCPVKLIGSECKRCRGRTSAARALHQDRRRRR